MKPENFIIALENYYECKYPQEMINRVSKWMTGNGIRDDHLDKIFDNVTAFFKPYSYKTKPDLKDIIDCFKDSSVDTENLSRPFENQKKMISEMTAKEILKMLKIIRKKDEVSTMEIDILHDWGMILTEYDVMMEKKIPPEEIKAHLEMMKDAIANGRRYDSIFNHIQTRELFPDTKERGLHEIKEVV